MRNPWFSLCLAGSILAASVPAQDPAPASAAKGHPNEGDIRSIRFTVPFKKALAQAREEQRLIFLKPILGGVDQIGARDYRCGSW